MLYNKSLLILCYSCLLLIAGCTTTDVSTQDFAQSGSAARHEEASELAAGDAIEVSVEVDGRMEVSRHRTELNPQGYVTLPLVGDVLVQGMKLQQARNVIHKTYAAYYVNPPVTMVSRMGKAEAGEWGEVTVMGRVRNPGRIPLPDADGINLTEAIQGAGGFSPSAKPTGIKISRMDANGKKLQVTVDYEAIGQGGNAAADINLLDGDIIYVPERIF